MAGSRPGRKSPDRYARAALLCALLASAAARADAPPYPKFRPGLWQREATMDVNGKLGTQQTSKCGDPTDGMRAIFVPDPNAQGCRFSTPEQHGNRYSITSDCGSHGRSHIEVTQHSGESFTMVIDTRMGNTQVHETVVARRVGECSK